MQNQQRSGPLAGWALVLFSLVLTACSGGQTQTEASAQRNDLPPQPVVSPNDGKAYRLLALDNELQVLLISDPDAKKAAASLDVHVGSGDNPADREGLAHFLEHMLFLGTEKYPDAAAYERFITEHGGSHNAYTSLEHTNYFFDIEAPYLPEILDRFAQFFIAPRFDAQYVDREKNAVEAEYQMGLKSDSRRNFDVVQSKMNPDHPFSKFTVGSLETLADREDATIRDDLLAFYDKHYSANVMRLAVLGTESLDELEAMVRPLFGQIPNRNVELQQIEAPLFAQGTLPMMIRIKPQATQRSMDLAFPIPEYRAQYHTKPTAYLSNLIGHEGEGSLLSQLKVEGLAESLSAGSGVSWRGGGLMNIGVSLTEKGVQEYERVIQLFFAYIDVLREAGPQRSIYNEQGQLAELAFRFREESEAIGYVSGVSNTMQYFAPEDVLRGGYIMDDYQPKLLNEALSYIRPDNMLVELVDADVQTDSVSPYYAVPFSAQPLDETTLARWTAPVGQVALHLPAPNEFIAEDLDLVELPQMVPALPERVIERERLTAWFKQDSEFRVPRGATYINFRSTAVGATADQAAAAMLYVALLKDGVNEFAYPALLAGLSFDLYKHSQGISLRISGYNDKQLVLLERILAAIGSGRIDDQRFADIRADMIRGLRNVDARRPSGHAMLKLREALLHGEFSETALIDAAERMTPAALLQYGEDFWAAVSAEILVYGNYEPEQVERVANLVDTLLPDGSAPELEPLRVTKVQPGDNLQFDLELAHDDSVVAWYLQGPGDVWEDRAAASLSGQIMRSGFFQQLRTERQLGYVVSAFAYPQLDVPGIAMIVQSPGYSAPAVQAEMAAFLGRVQGEIDAAQFERHKAALLSEILKPEKNLWERAEFYWQSIARKRFEFDSRYRMAEAVTALDLASWNDYFTENFLQQQRSLEVVAPGRSGELPEAGKRYSASQPLKAEQPYYTIDP